MWFVDNAGCAVRRQLTAQGDFYGRSARIPIGDGDASIERTVQAMRAIVEHASRHPLVHQFASTIVAAAPNRDQMAQLRGLDQAMRDVLNFKPDTMGDEVLRHPAQILHEVQNNGRAACDCDDQAMLGAATLRAMGIKPAIRVVAHTPTSPFVHVHFAGLVEQPQPRLVPLDPQERIPVGMWTPAGRHRVWWA